MIRLMTRVTGTLVALVMLVGLAGPAAAVLAVKDGSDPAPQPQTSLCEASIRTYVQHRRVGPHRHKHHEQRRMYVTACEDGKMAGPVRFGRWHRVRYSTSLR